MTSNLLFFIFKFLVISINQICFFLNRSAMVNLSVNVFGENLNLLEFGGRAEGFEPLVEGLFGQVQLLFLYRKSKS